MEVKKEKLYFEFYPLLLLPELELVPDPEFELVPDPELVPVPEFEFVPPLFDDMFFRSLFIYIMIVIICTFIVIVLSFYQ